jgi:outer membrane lipoprotein-sorting protein
MTFTALPYHMPVILLSREFSNADYSIQMGTPATVEGKAAVQVVIKTMTNVLADGLSEQDWDFDATTGLPVRIEYRLSSGLYTTDWIQAAVELSNYRMTNGVAVPYQVTIFEEGVAQATAQISAVTFNTGVAPSLFDSPVGGAQ